MIEQESSGGGHAPQARRLWSLRLHGDPALIAPTGQVHALERRAAALLALVAIEPGLTRQRAAAWLWPESEAAQARQALRQQLARLKRLADGVVVGEAALRLGDGVETDLASHDAGELLGAFDYGDSEALGQWVERQRALRRARAIAALGDEAAAAEARGDPDAALAAARRLHALDESDEGSLRLLMRLLYLGGDSAGALREHDRFVQRLAPDRRGALAPETRTLWATVRDAAQTPATPAASTARRPPPAALLRPPLLVGRERELARLEQAVGEGRVAWLVGEAGQGKSRLLEAAAAAGPGRVVVSSRPGDTGTPYASLARWLRTLMQREPGADAGWPRLELAPLLPEYGMAPAGGGLDSHGARLPSALATVWRQAAEQGVHWLLIDDLHFADAASVEMLQTLLCDAPSASPAVVLAARPVMPTAAGALQAMLEEAGRLTPVALGPLDRAAVAALVDSLGLPGIDGEHLAPALLRHTGGNPMYVLETLKTLWQRGGRGGRGGELPLPAPVTAMIERRLRQLSTPALNLARVAAVAAVDFSIELAEQVLQTQAMALADAWNELEAAQVLRGGGFAHDLVFEVTLASIPAPIARHTHAAVARQLEARSGDAARIARHWIEAGEAPRALAALHAAADAARKALRPREQAGFLEQAAAIEREAGRSEAAFGSLREAAAARIMTDRDDASEAIARLVALAQTPHQRASALALRCDWLATRGDHDGVIAAAQEALADCADDERLRCELLQAQGTALSLQGCFTQAVEVLRQAQRWVEREGSPVARLDFAGDLAVTLDNADRYAEAQAEHRKALALAFEAGDHANAVIVLGNLAVSLSSTGALEEATEVLMRGERLAAAHDELRGAACMTPAMLSRVLRDQSRFDEALRWGEIGLREIQAQAPAWAPVMQVNLATTWLHLGQHARAWQVLAQAGEPDKLPLWQASAVWLGRARLKRALEQGGATEAAQALALAPTEGRRPLWAAVQLEQALHLDNEAAAALVEHVHDDACRRQLHGVRLAALARMAALASARGAHGDALAAAGQALQLSDSVWPDEMQRSEVWLHAGRAFDAAGEAARARAVFEQGAAWVREVARSHVPEIARDSFVQRNPVHQALLAEASRPGRR